MLSFFGFLAASVAMAAPASKIEHVVVIIQENHSFDNYFGTYCQAPTGSNPTCTEGAQCCEAAPALDPGTGIFPVLLNDAENGAFDPDHSEACELAEMNGGRMDRFVAGPSCANPRNFAYSSESDVSVYRDWARRYALADRYFQPTAGASSANDMYFARARFVFTDNTVGPNAIGAECVSAARRVDYFDPTIGDLLTRAGVSWTFYSGGYRDMVKSRQRGSCPAIPAQCTARIAAWPCFYDPSDNPFAYYPSVRDRAETFKDTLDLEADLAQGRLPAVSYVKAIGYETEHPGGGMTISAGMSFVKRLVDRVLASPYAAKTLILLTMDESGGYFDHVAPPPTSPVDGKAYGPRVPTLALGPFARTRYVSHVTLEHSSIVKFIEWNWLGRKSGQLGTRDVAVNNLGSLIDPVAAGVAIPEGAAD